MNSRNFLITAVLLVLLGLVSWVPAQSYILPEIDYSSITLYENGGDPAVYGPPRVCQSVYVGYVMTNTQKRITNIAVRGDSLIVTTGTVSDPVTSGNMVVFDRMGIYRAFEYLGQMEIYGPDGNRIVPMYKSLGSFRILPGMSTTPGAPLVGAPVTLNLVLGQMYSYCPPVYTGTAVVKGNDIYLSYREIPVDIVCIQVVPTEPVQYGPSFDLGALDAGSYTVFIEDSINVGSIKVSDILVVHGRVTVMQHPLVRMIPAAVAGATVVALPAPQCDWYGRMAYDSITAVTGSDGRFTMNLPLNAGDYSVTVTKAGYHPQTVFTSNYSVMYSNPPQMALSFELLQESLDPVTNLTISVTYNGAPVDSAYVYLAGGREMILCAYEVEDPKVLAKAQAAVGYFWDYTDRQGLLKADSLSMKPYIDYIYNISKRVSGQYLTKRGIIRLNKYWNNTLHVDLGTVSAENSPAGEAARPLTAAPNPFNPETRISIGEHKTPVDLFIYDVGGRLVKQFRKVKGNSVTWNAAGLSSGVYIVKARIDNKHYTKKLFLQK
jgi:hypothetical protein